MKVFMVHNQNIVFTPEETLFISYGNTIIKTTHEDGKRVVYLDEDHYKYSQTTIKYRNKFLGKTTKEVEAKIKSGEYILTNLNP